MTTPASDPNEDSKMKKILSGNVTDSIRAKLPHANNAATARVPAAPKEPPAPKGAMAPTGAAAAATPSRPRPIPAPAAAVSTPPPAPAPDPAPAAAEQAPREPRYKFLPAFWTIASVLSLTVNLILLIALLVMAPMLFKALQEVKRLQSAQILQNNPQAMLSGFLGGLYTNFVKMDQATITSTIPVDAMIPLNITVPVQTTTQIRLAESVVIPNAHVRINTGGLNINADAVVTLPANTPLTVALDFPLQVQNTIPVHLDVPVNIPLNQTQLHEPFSGLQKVVEPWYCFVEPNATVNGMQVCSQTTKPAPAETVNP